MGKLKNKENTSQEVKSTYKPRKLSSAAFMKRLPFTLSEEQKKFIDAIYDAKNKIVFCNAKAGSGKTQLAMAAACAMVEYGMYKDITYIFPMVNFQQELGLLPGTLEDKTMPFYTPAIQALNELGYDPKKVIMQLNQTPQKDGAFVDCIPHTFLRGVNFKDTVVLLDESENMYLSELRKILTRVNDNCKVIVIGHDGQCDLFKNPQNSGFIPYLNWFKDEEYCEVCELTQNFRGVVSNKADEMSDEIVKRKEV